MTPAHRGLSGPKQFERDFRLVQTDTPFEWVVPHTYRKTVATFLDHGGLSARVVADQLGHARISMIQDVYWAVMWCTRQPRRRSKRWGLIGDANRYVLVRPVAMECR